MSRNCDNCIHDCVCAPQIDGDCPNWGNQELIAIEKLMAEVQKCYSTMQDETIQLHKNMHKISICYDELQKIHDTMMKGGRE